MANECPSQEILDKIFPPEKTDTFFDAIYGGAEEGAYDIRLTCQKITDNQAFLAFQLLGRPGKCLKCNLTYGLPNVFMRHPLLDIAGVAQKVADALGWTGAIEWRLNAVEEISNDLHVIPFEIKKA